MWSEAIRNCPSGVVLVVTVQTSKVTWKCPAVKIFWLENDGKFEVSQDSGSVR